MFAGLLAFLASDTHATAQNIYEPNANTVANITAEQARANFLSLVSSGRLWGFKGRAYWIPVLLFIQRFIPTSLCGKRSEFSLDGRGALLR